MLFVKKAEHTNAETTAETNAATTEKHINIRAYCNEAEAVLIEISNNGPAIPPDIASSNLAVSSFISAQSTGIHSLLLRD